MDRSPVSGMQAECWPGELEDSFNSRCVRFIHQYLAHPRVILTGFGFLMTAISVSTLFNEPGYLVAPKVYIVAGFLGAGVTFFAIFSPTKWSMALSGALIAGAMSSRGIGLAMTTATQPWRGDISWTFIVGSLAYFVILSMLPPVWIRYLIPWAVEKVK